MNNFSEKKSDNKKSFGCQLIKKRGETNLKLEEAARRLGIRLEYLEAIESDRFDLLPAGIYGRNFLKRYAKYLKIADEELKWQLDMLEQEGKDDPFAKKAIDKKNLRIFPKIIRNAAIITAIAICFLYLAFYARRIVSPPELKINYPEDNLLTKNRVIKIEGQTEGEAELKINGELVLNNDNGEFSQEISLKSGLNSITISAKKKYSKENIIIRQILVE